LSVKGWIIPYISFAVGMGFTAITFLTGETVNETHWKLLDYIIVMTLGSGAIGATKKGFEKYQEFKKDGN
jgi:hypothetical protein